MTYRLPVLLVMMILGSAVPSTFAQSTRRVFLHGDAGLGSMEDSQGGLGKGLSVGGGIGGVLKDEIEVELSVTRLHHEKGGATPLNGDITSFMGRFLYRSGGPGSTGRLIAGAGAGYYSYSRVQTDSAGAVSSTAGGFAYETGAGVELAVHKNGFVRPELWLTNTRGSITKGTGVPPPYLIIRGGVSAGWRF